MEQLTDCAETCKIESQTNPYHAKSFCAPSKNCRIGRNSWIVRYVSSARDDTKESFRPKIVQLTKIGL